MKQFNFKIVLALLSTSVIVIQCKKKATEKEVYVYKTDTIRYSWKPYRKIAYAPIIYKITYSKIYDRPLVLFYNPLSSYIYDSIDNTFSLIFPSSLGAYSSVIPPDINDFLGTSLSEPMVSLSVFMPYLTSYSSSCWQNKIVLNLNNIDTNFNFIYQRSNHLSEKGYRWVTTYSRKNNKDAILILDFKDSSCFIKLKQMIIIPTNNVQTSVAGSFNNRYILNLPYDGVYLLREDNTLSMILPEAFIPSNFIVNHNNNIYIYDAYHEIIYYSADNGESWQVHKSNIYLSSIPIYKVLNNNIFAFYNDKIFSVDLSNKNFIIKELKNDGLTNSRIMDAFYSNDTVIITTSQGLYYKKYSDLFN